MDIQASRTTAGMSDKSCFHNTLNLAQLSSPATIAVDSLTEATHFPNGFVKPGTILARYTSGANDGMWGAHVPDSTDGVGLENSDAVVWDGFYIDALADGSTLPDAVAGSILLAGLPVQMLVAKMPGLLDDADAAHTVVAADLPTGFIAVDLGV